MPRIRKFIPEREFRGNKSVNSLKVSTPVRPKPPTDRTRLKLSSSSKKIYGSRLPKDLGFTDSQVNFIVDLELISNLIQSFVRCKFCENIDCVTLRLDQNFASGLVHRMIVG